MKEDVLASLPHISPILSQRQATKSKCSTSLENLLGIQLMLVWVQEVQYVLDVINQSTSRSDIWYKTPEHIFPFVQESPHCRAAPFLSHGLLRKQQLWHHLRIRPSLEELRCLSRPQCVYLQVVSLVTRGESARVVRNSIKGNHGVC